MAIVLNDQDLEDKSKQTPQQAQQSSQGGPIAVGGVQGGTQAASNQASAGAAGNAPKPVVAGPVNPSQQQAGSSGRFQNLHKFIQANNPGQFGQQFQEKAGQVAKEGQAAIGKATTDFNSQADAQSNQLGAVNKNLDLAKTNLAGSNNFDQGVDQLKAGLGAQYQGAQGLNNEAILASQAQQAGQIANMAGSQGGRAALLGRLFGNSGYNAGQGRLDNMLLGSQTGAINQLRQQGRAVGNQLQQAQQDTGVQVGNLQQQAKEIQANAKGIGSSASGAINQQLVKDASDFANQQNSLYDQKNLNDYAGQNDINIAGMNLSADQRQRFAANGGIGVQGGSLNKGQLDDLRSKGDYSSILGQTSEGAQANAGRFNKLAQLMGGSAVKGGDLLKGGQLGVSAAKRAELESTVGAEGLSNAEQGYTADRMNNQNIAFTDKAFREAGGTADQQAKNEFENMKAQDLDRVHRGGSASFNTDTMTTAQQQAWLANRGNQIRNEGGKSNWAGDRAREKGTASLAKLKDRNSDEGKAYYNDQLSSARKAALQKLLGN